MADLPGLESFVGHHCVPSLVLTGQPIVNRSAVPSFPLSPVPSFRRSPVPPGFTLIEILVVITVIAILAGLVTPMVFRNVGDAKVAAARAQIETFGLALDTYYLHNDAYPTTEQGLQALVTSPVVPPFTRSAVPSSPRNWRGPYLKKGIPPDPWGNPYQYLSPGTANPASYDLLSYGRDGKPGGTGDDADLSSWELPSP